MLRKMKFVQMSDGCSVQSGIIIMFLLGDFLIHILKISHCAIRVEKLSSKLYSIKHFASIESDKANYGHYSYIEFISHRYKGSDSFHTYKKRRGCGYRSDRWTSLFPANKVFHFDVIIAICIWNIVVTVNSLVVHLLTQCYLQQVGRNS